MKKISILITDDHRLLRETWSFILNLDSRFEVVAQCGSAEEMLTVAPVVRPDIVIMDINLPGMTGIEALPKIKKFVPGVKILGVSLHSQPSYVKAMLRNGASGYLTKNSGKNELIQALLTIHEGKKYLCEEIKNIISEQAINGPGKNEGINSLSQREIEVISYIKQGYSSKQIAATLFLSTKTVEVHRYNIFRKLGLKNAANLVDFINHHPEFDAAIATEHRMAV